MTQEIKILGSTSTSSPSSLGYRQLAVSFTGGRAKLFAGDNTDTAQEINSPANVIGITPSTSNAHQVVTVKGDGSGFEAKNDVPTYTTTARNALSNVPTDHIIYNSTAASFQKYNGSTWDNVGGGSGGAFNEITSGTNTTAAMVVGSGASLAATGTGTIAATTVVTNANLTGDVTSVGNATTLATVNSNVGSFGSSTQTTALTVNAKGLITAASNTTITPAVGSITGLGTGVSTALAVNTGSSGAFVVNGGALGTPSSGVATNLTGLPLTTGVTGTLPIANGGTNATTASAARTNLGLVIGTDVQAYDADTAKTDVVQLFTVAQRFGFSTLTDAATVAVDLALANNYKLTLAGNRTLGIPTNVVAGQEGTITVRQDSTGGRTLAYSWPYIFPQLLAPALSTGKGAMDLLAYKVLSYSTATATMTIATPCVVTWTGHGLVYGQILAFTTTGALPTGITANTRYYVNVINANTFNLATSLPNLQAATYVATSGSQSGTHTAINMEIEVALNLNNGS